MVKDYEKRIAEIAIAYVIKQFFSNHNDTLSGKPFLGYIVFSESIILLKVLTMLIIL